MKFFRRILRSIQIFMHNNLIDSAASLAYYALFSLVPILLLILFAARSFFDAAEVNSFLISQISALIGQTAGTEIAEAISRWTVNDQSTFYTVLGFVLIVYAATSVFSTLISAFDRIIPPEYSDAGSKTLIRYLEGKLMSVILIGAIALIILSSFIANIFLHSRSEAFLERLTGMSMLSLNLLDFGLHFFVLSLSFWLMFWLFIKADLRRKDLLHAAVFTTLLFIGGKSLLGIYINSNEAMTIYSSAGTIIIILFWTYYSGGVILLGCAYLRALKDERIIAEDESRLTGDEFAG